MFYFFYNIFNCSSYVLLNFICLQEIEDPHGDVIEESLQVRRGPVSRRVEEMFAQTKSRLPGAPKFLLCLLPERKNCEVYGRFMFLVVFICYPAL